MYDYLHYSKANNNIVIIKIIKIINKKEVNKLISYIYNYKSSIKFLTNRKQSVSSHFF